MKTVKGTELAWTEKECAEFRQRLQTFREELPEPQRKVFNGIMVGADALFKRFKRADAVDEGTPFSQKLATFRDELPPQQRDAFTSILMASAVAWGVDVGRAQQGEGGSSGASPGVVYMLHALLPAAAIITLGVVLVVDELSGDDVEPQAPDLTGIPTTPEDL